MKGNTIREFMDDILIAGGPEKEFVFRDKFYFLEIERNRELSKLELHIDEYERVHDQEGKYIRRYSFFGENFADCKKRFEKAKIFDGLTIYEAEPEVEVLFG